jgi:hypothetical protein
MTPSPGKSRRPAGVYLQPVAGGPCQRPGVAGPSMDIKARSAMGSGTPKWRSLALSVWRHTASRAVNLCAVVGVDGHAAVDRKPGCLSVISRTSCHESPDVRVGRVNICRPRTKSGDRRCGGNYTGDESPSRFKSGTTAQDFNGRMAYRPYSTQSTGRVRTDPPGPPVNAETTDIPRSVRGGSRTPVVVSITPAGRHPVPTGPVCRGN